jgi:methylmalonyl-CoA mutase
MNKTDNPLQGAYLVEELVDIVEEAVLCEFERISDKGGVLGAMESMYQRGKIQDESLYYETLKDSGEFPIIGVNTYISENVSQQMHKEIEITRSSNEEKQDQINRLDAFKNRNSKKSEEALNKLKEVAVSGKNIFEELLSTVNHCSLGQITEVLYEVGGRYRRNI